MYDKTKPIQYLEEEEPREAPIPLRFQQPTASTAHHTCKKKRTHGFKMGTLITGHPKSAQDGNFLHLRIASTMAGLSWSQSDSFTVLKNPMFRRTAETRSKLTPTVSLSTLRWGFSTPTWFHRQCRDLIRSWSTIVKTWSSSSEQVMAGWGCLRSCSWEEEAKMECRERTGGQETGKKRSSPRGRRISAFRCWRVLTRRT